MLVLNFLSIQTPCRLKNSIRECKWLVLYWFFNLTNQETVFWWCHTFLKIRLLTSWGLKTPKVHHILALICLNNCVFNFGTLWVHSGPLCGGQLAVNRRLGFKAVPIPSMGSNLILQWLQKYVIAKAGGTCGLRTAMFTHCCILLSHAATLMVWWKLTYYEIYSEYWVIWLYSFVFIHLRICLHIDIYWYVLAYMW